MPFNKFIVIGTLHVPFNELDSNLSNLIKCKTSIYVQTKMILQIILTYNRRHAERAYYY